MGAGKCFQINNILGNNQVQANNRQSQLHYNMPLQAESFTEFDNTSKEFESLADTQQANIPKIDINADKLIIESITVIKENTFKKEVNLKYIHEKFQYTDSLKNHETQTTLELPNRGFTFTEIYTEQFRSINQEGKSEKFSSQDQDSSFDEQEFITNTVNDLVLVDSDHRMKHLLAVQEQQLIKTMSVLSKNQKEQLQTKQSNQKAIKSKLLASQLQSIQESEEYINSIRTSQSSINHDDHNPQINANIYQFVRMVRKQEEEDCLDKFRRTSTNKPNRSTYYKQIAHSLF